MSQSGIFLDIGTADTTVVSVWVKESDFAAAPPRSICKIAEIPPGSTILYFAGQNPGEPLIRHNGAVKILEYSYTAGER